MPNRTGPGAPGVAVVGGSLGGLRAAEQLRAAGWRGPITVYGEEPQPPYNRPPLSKDVLAGKAGPDSTALRRRASAEDVEWRLGSRVTGADLAAGTLTLEDGQQARYAGLVAATGIRPRRLSAPGEGPPRHVLRSLSDAAGLRAALVPGARIAVVGAGFVGCEVAATARQSGCRVTVVAPEHQPLTQPLGELLAGVLRERHESAGVRFLLGRTPAAFTRTGLTLDDGTRLPADAVVEAVGSLPNTDWLAGNGLDLTDGVRCDGQLRAGGLSHVVAVGDVARFPNARYGGAPCRVEHWSIPGDTAKHAARTLTAALHGEAPPLAPCAPLPAFWSDQYELRIQSFGAPQLADDTQLLERLPDDDTRGGLLMGYHRHGHLVGVTALGGPRAAAAAGRYRAELQALPEPESARL